MKRLVLGVVLGALLVSGVAYAAIPESSSGTFTGCYAKGSGALRVIDASAACTKSEARITWNQQGQPGPQGNQGPQGQPGEPGASPTVDTYTRVVQVEVPPSGGGDARVLCDVGDLATGGGYQIVSFRNTDDLIVVESRPENLGFARGWMAYAFNRGTTTYQFQVNVTCLVTRWPSP